MKAADTIRETLESLYSGEWLDWKSRDAALAALASLVEVAEAARVFIKASAASRSEVHSLQKALKCKAAEDKLHHALETIEEPK